LLFPGDPGVSRGLVHMDKNNISPRLGFAWDPSGKGKMSVRAAFGVFYGAVSGQAVDSSTNGNPFSIRQQFNNVATLANPYANLPGGLSPFPFIYDPANPKFTTPSTVSGTSLDFRWPYTYQLNVSVQRQVSRDVSLTAAYVGSLGRRLPFTRDLNYPIYTAAATSSNVDQRRPILPGQFAAISMVESIMNTSYHGLQFTGEKRMGHGLSVKGYYTYSKSLEGARLQNDTTAGGAEDMRNLRLERGRTDNDRKHNFVMSLIWQLNYVQNASSVLGSIANGWAVSAIASARSGTPLTVTAGTDVNLDGTNNDRANLVGNPVLDPNRPRSQVTAMWFSTAAFQRPAAGQDGNAGRNIIDAPGQKNIDLGLFREFRFGERVHLQFRAEITNAFNMVNLSDPTTNLSSSLFGQTRTARAMRETQLGLRLVF
jgi:hypothetical protein